MANKTVYNPLLSAGFQLVTAPIAQTVVVSPSGGDYATIQDALDSITDATANKQYLIKVEPGTYGPFIAKAFCHIQAALGTVTVAGVDATALTSNIAAGEYCNMQGLTFVNYSASDNATTANLVGDVNMDLCYFYLIKTNDTSGVALRTSTTVQQILGRCLAYVQPLVPTTKYLDGIRANGDGLLSMYLTSVSIEVNAASGDTCCIDENGTGERNYNNCLLLYKNSNASYSGTAKGFCVSSKSTKQRLSQGSQVRLEGAGAGTAYAFALDSDTNDAEYFHTNSVVAISGFTAGQEGVAFTGVGDVQRVWLSSTNKDLPKFGTGISVITPLDKEETGFVEWGPEATFWDYNTGTAVFTVKKSGAGVVRGAPMSWLAEQTVVLTDRAVNFVYMDSKGVIGVATSGAGLYDDNVVLFEVWRQGTNYIVVKENHPYKFTTAVSEAWHNLFGTLLSDASQTLAINSAANRTVNLVGSNTLTDHGLDTTITAQTPITFRQMVEGVSGAMVQVANAQGLVSVESNGTDTGANVPNGRYIVYRIGVLKESLNSSTPTFVSLADNVDTANLSAANSRITGGLVRPFPAEARRLEIAQLGFAILQANGAGAGTLEQVTTALQVFGAQFVSGGTSSSGALITLDTTAFAGALSGTETNVQLMANRLDLYTSLLNWTTGRAYRIGNIVRVTTEGFIGMWRCVTAHTAAAAFTTDVNSGNWEIVANSEGSRELVNQASHGFVAGTPVARVGGTYVAAACTTEALAEVYGIITGVTTNYFVLAKTGKITISGAAWPLEGGNANLVDNTTYWLSATAGKLTATKPSTVGYIEKPLINSTGTTSGNVLNMRGTTVGGTNVYTTIALANNAATTIQNVSGSEFPAGTGGYIEGFIKIDATTDAVITFKAEWSKPITGTAYKCSVQTGADDLPAGLIIDITTGGLIQVTLPSVTGFSSASATFAMQAAAIGATLPLQIASDKITWDVTTLTNADATQLGLKQYLHGTNYNGGNAPTVSKLSGTANLTSVDYAAFVPYKMQDGKWRLRGNVKLTTSGAATDFAFQINGVTLISAIQCGVMGSPGSTPVAMYLYIASGSGFLSVAASSPGTTPVYSFDIEIASKPTWAY